MLSYAAICKDGGRAVNEDSAGEAVAGGAYLFAVADGLGGHGGGDVASKLAVDISIEEFKKALGRENLAQCFTRAQDELMEFQRQRGKTSAMKTTLVLLWVGGSGVRWGHIGDSRLYVFYDGRLVTHTRDHSVPQTLVIAGEIQENEIRGHPDRNRLLRVIGTEWDSPRYELSGEKPVVAGMAFLLCSDGFWELIEDDDMCACLKTSKTPSDWLKAMEQLVLQNGKGRKMDNYTALAVFLH